MAVVSGKYFDTINTITADCDIHILQEAMELCAFYNARLSKTIPGSDIWNINHADGASVTIGRDTLSVLETAASLYAASEGAFNIAVGPVIELWQFNRGEAKIPDTDKIKQALRHTDFGQIIISGRTVKMPAGMMIDLGGIAKGYIADQVAGFLRDQGVQDAILNFGGNIVTIGNRPDGTSWIIGLQNPFGERGKDYWAAVPCSNGSVVTSGIYERGFEINGVRYNHFIDPRTGWPVQNGLVSVTAVSSKSVLADGLTTAMFILGKDRGMKLLQQFDAKAAFLFHDGTVTYSPDMGLIFIKSGDK